MKSETHSFTIGKNMIYHSIKSQAGSIEKAILECLMNAVDAGASKVYVDLDANGIDYTVTDNGRGFISKDEIINCFGAFGFDHDTKEEKLKNRTFGTFGIGRAQLWAFSSNIWLTNEFKLDVDIKSRDLNYIISTVSKPFKGCKIVGKFYETQTLGEIQNIQRNLIKMALYLPISFYLNGKCVSKKLDEQKWTHEVNDAYIKFNDTGSLDIYNQGVFVKSFSNYEYGKGGVVVTTSPLKLNQARNDIMKSSCSLWKRLGKYLKDTATKDNLKKTTLDDNARKNLLLQWVSNELSFNDLKGKAILPDIKGRYRTLSVLEKTCFRFTIADNKHSQVGENIYASGNVFVFSPIIFDIFNISSGEELVDILEIKYKNYFYECKKLEFISFDKLKSQYKSKHDIIIPSKYSKKQKVFMSIYETIVKECSVIINSYFKRYGDNAIVARKGILGNSETALAWTDSTSFIAIDRNTLALIDQGNRGINKIINIVIHEYLHNESSIEDHAHSHEFYENFHNIIIEKFTDINTLLINMNKKYINVLMKNNLALPREYIRESRRENETLKLMD